MDGLLRALGFDSKPSYTEKIPEDLDPSDFKVHEVSCLNKRKAWLPSLVVYAANSHKESHTSIHKQWKGL